MEINIEKPARLPQDFYVYLHRKATTGEVFYVGKGFGNRAWTQCNRSLHWFNTTRKHGVTVEIVADFLQEWYAHELECELIAMHGRRDLGYGPLVNLTDGGEGASGIIPSSRTKAKLRERSQRLAADPEWRSKRKEVAQRLAQDPAWLTKRATLVSSPEWRSKNKAAMQRLAADPEWLAKNKAANRARLCRPVECIETGERFDSATDAAALLSKRWHKNVGKSLISRVARGIQNSAYGYTWRYIDEVRNEQSGHA